MLRIRVLSLSLYGLGFLVLAASLPVSLPLALGIDAIRRKRLATCRLLFFLLVLLNYEAAGVIRAVILWLRWGRHGKEFEERYLRENFELECWWGSSIMLWTQRIYGFTIATRGAEQLASGPYLLFPRHASVGDTVLWPLLVSRLHGIDLRYVVKEELQWDPCLGIVGSRRHHVFVKRGSSDSAGEIARVAQLGRDLGPRDGVLLYPEGTRFTPAKRLRILGKLAAAGDEERGQVAQRAP